MTPDEFRAVLLAEQFGPVTRQWRDTRPAAEAQPILEDSAEPGPLAPVVWLDDRRAS